MPYDAHNKSSSVMKTAVNSLLEQNAHRGTRAVVIDAESLQSSKALMRGGALAKNIFVINDNKSIIAKARKQGHIGSVRGISTKILKDLHGTFDIIYLDYCGTPDDTFNGFLPRVDFWWAAANLTPNGFIVATFSKRTLDAKQKARDLVPSTLSLTFDMDYFETSAMYMMVMSPHKHNVPLRFMFQTMHGQAKDAITNLKETPTKKLEKTPKKTSNKPPNETPKKAPKKKPKKTPKKKAKKPPAKYAVGDRVGVNYRMENSGNLEMFYATVKFKQRGKSGMFKYFLDWENGDRSHFLNEEHITCKATIIP